MPVCVKNMHFFVWPMSSCLTSKCARFVNENQSCSLKPSASPWVDAEASRLSPYKALRDAVTSSLSIPSLV